MKSIQAPNLKTIAPTKAMYTVIRSYEDQAFNDMSKESEEKKNLSTFFFIKKMLQPVQRQGIVEQTEQNGGLNPQRVDRGLTKIAHRHL